MTQATMWIIADTMFGISVEQSKELEQLGNDAQKIVVGDLSPLLPEIITGRDKKTAKINAALTGLVQRFKTEAAAKGNADRKDLLSILMAMRDENGQPMSDAFLRDNILTMFFAGHETTANTLSWAFYYLAQNPSLLKELQKEVDGVLAGQRLPKVEDLPNLPFTLQVIKETMRIQPTVAMIPRGVRNDTALGEYRLKGGATLLISPYVQHHDPRRWPNPDVFDPARFSAENEDKIEKFSYMPFGGGPRICIGNHFALMEAQILLALIVSRYELTLAPGANVRPLRQVTTSPKFGLPMIVRRRAE
jgi:cytochrome P450